MNNAMTSFNKYTNHLHYVFVKRYFIISNAPRYKDRPSSDEFRHFESLSLEEARVIVKSIREYFGDTLSMWNYLNKGLYEISFYRDEDGTEVWEIHPELKSFFVAEVITRMAMRRWQRK